MAAPVAQTKPRLDDGVNEPPAVEAMGRWERRRALWLYALRRRRRDVAMGLAKRSAVFRVLTSGGFAPAVALPAGPSGPHLSDLPHNLPQKYETAPAYPHLPTPT